MPARDGKSVPWLLLAAKSTGGPGMLANVRNVQRLETSGGVAPTAACNLAEKGKEMPVPYEASYYFYGPSQQ